MSWLWSNPASASSSKLPETFPSAPIEVESSAGPSSQSREHLERASSTIHEDTPSTRPTTRSENGESSSAQRYQRILSDEEKYQAKQYPTFEEVPGCMQLFDEFMMCYALVPQLRSFYRRGDFHDCGWKFKDFKYCLSLKSEPEERRVELWTKRRAEWWANRRFDASSEDVWDMREKPPVNFPPVHTEEEPIPAQTDDKVVT